MARLAKHGQEVGTLFFTTSAKRFMSDGMVLKNIEFGWKRLGTVKEGWTPEAVYLKQKAHQDDVMAAYPARKAYREALHAAAGLSKRWKLHAAIEMMPDDADGVWSEACDGYGDNCSLDVNEVSNLCKLYLAAIAEAKDSRKENV